MLLLIQHIFHIFIIICVCINLKLCRYHLYNITIKNHTYILCECNLKWLTVNIFLNICWIEERNIKKGLSLWIKFIIKLNAYLWFVRAKVCVAVGAVVVGVLTAIHAVWKANTWPAPGICKITYIYSISKIPIFRYTFQESLNLYFV